MEPRRHSDVERPMQSDGGVVVRDDEAKEIGKYVCVSGADSCRRGRVYRASLALDWALAPRTASWSPCLAARGDQTVLDINLRVVVGLMMAQSTSSRRRCGVSVNPFSKRGCYAQSAMDDTDKRRTRLSGWNAR